MTDYIIIQAGGLGSRLKQYTANKPKGLVPVNNVPIIFNLFNRYPDRRFIIIGDYLHEVLEEYLETFCHVTYITVKAEGKGTCAGVADALHYVPEQTPFMLIWSDLILGEQIEIDQTDAQNYLGISKDFECRWSYENQTFIEKPSKEQGVAGLFIWKDKTVLNDLPKEGELVRWLSEKKINFKELPLSGTREVGTVLALEENTANGYRCRPFNRMEILEDRIIKRPLDAQGRELAEREVNWYKEVQNYSFDQIPKLYSLDPLTMEKIDGNNIFRVCLSPPEKRIVIDRLVDSLNRLHAFKHVDTDYFSVMEAYYHKTVKRLENVRDLIPFANCKYIRINGKNCRNPYFYKRQFRERVKQLLCKNVEFALIHGDCTFSNTMVSHDLNVIFLDPRGYFGFSELYGDVAYDWAKLYYSIFGNYDQFNNRNFQLDITDQEIRLHIGSNGWEDMADYFLSKITGCSAEKIRFLHSIIWLSLTTYAWEDYDSICGAFYNGTYLLEEFL